MLKRLAVAALGIPLFLVVCVWGVRAFSIGILITAAIGLVELLYTLYGRGIRANPIIAALGLLGPAWYLVVHNRTPGFVVFPLPVFTVCVIAIMMAFVWEVVAAVCAEEIRIGRNLGYGFLCGVYVALFAGLTSLRGWPGSDQLHVRFAIDAGAAAVILTTLCIWATDTFALFAGRWWGKRKLAPRLSPAKTVEGALGGFVASILAGAGFGYLLTGSAVLGLLIGAFAGISGQFGDLFESAMKREIGVKDFGFIFPGHGGVLDRFDSLLFVAPVVSLALYLLGLF